MTRPRSALVSLSETPWYHVVNRCVRRAFLCGHDAASGRSFEHRRGWIETRIRELASVFAIDVAAYAIMSNHYHIVVRVDAPRALAWSTEEVLRRWTAIFAGPPLIQRYLSEARSSMSAGELARVLELAALYRQRLFDLSWFMRTLNETIARMANAEDGCKGRFWEGRFRSQALLDEQALLAAMVYVDLNPIRAGLCESLADSAHTSIKARLDAMAAMPTPIDACAPIEATGHKPDTPPAETTNAQSSNEGTQQVQAALAACAPSRKSRGHSRHDKDEEDSAAPDEGIPSLKARQHLLRLPRLLSEAQLSRLPEAPLMPFDVTGEFAQGIPFGWVDYVELADAMGRAVHPHKRGFIPPTTPRLLQQMGLDLQAWVGAADRFFRAFATAVGTPARMLELASERQRRALRGMATARQLLQPRAA